MAPQFVPHGPACAKLVSMRAPANRRTITGSAEFRGPSDEPEETNDWAWITDAGREVDKPVVVARRQFCFAGKRNGATSRRRKLSPVAPA
jgi:hypothetical protein